MSVPRGLLSFGTAVENMAGSEVSAERFVDIELQLKI
jgi:hypothetical protein